MFLNVYNAAGQNMSITIYWFFSATPVSETSVLSWLACCTHVWMCICVFDPACTQCLCLCIVQILTGVTFDEFVMLNGSDHSCKPPHDVVQLLHLLRVASLQHWESNRGEVGRNKQNRNMQEGIKPLFIRQYVVVFSECVERCSHLVLIRFPLSYTVCITSGEQPLTCSSKSTTLCACKYNGNGY